MTETLNTANTLEQHDQTKHYDVLVIGGGVLGLWSAKILSEAGLQVALADKSHCGSGGSGGLMGALLPHMPSGWNEKKQFQFEALASMPRLIERLEKQTGLTTGYLRCGRLSPIRKPGFLRQTQSHTKKHIKVWRETTQNAGQDFSYEVASINGYEQWVEPSFAPLGLAYETLTGRINPRLYIQALQASVLQKADIISGFDFDRYDEAAGVAVSKDGKHQIIARKLVMTAGYETFELLAPYIGESVGAGIKGQAALFKLEGCDNYPVCYDDGIYIVPHEDGFCAIGSSSEKIWTEPNSTDYHIEQVIKKAKLLCPALREAELLETWAGVRPRCDAKDPLVGKIPQKPIYVATGGFKITLGIAHFMAEALCDIILERAQSVPLPSCYTMAYHLEKMAERREDEAKTKSL